VRQGKPRVFVSHGTGDAVLPYDYTAGTIVPSLRRDGYEVEFLPFPTGHGVPSVVGERAFEWFAGP
jgi:phospholipase/carboxylesterase